MWKNIQAENYGLCKWQNQISNKRELEDTEVIQGKIRKWVEQKRMQTYKDTCTHPLFKKKRYSLLQQIYVKFNVMHYLGSILSVI